MYSIKRQLVTAVIAGSLLVVLIGSVFLDVMIGFEMQKMFDTALLDKARALVTLTEQDIEGIEFEFADEVMPEFEDKDDLYYFQLWLKDDTVLERSRSLHNTDLPRFRTALNQHAFYDLTLPDGRPGRLVEIVFNPRIDTMDDVEIERSKADSVDLKKWQEWNKKLEPQRITLIVARERISLQQLRLANRVIIAGAMFSVLLAIVVLIKKFVSSGLMPLDQLAEQVRAIDERSLNSRITHGKALSIELAPIEQQLNKLLERLEAAFQREKRFSADVAHELRTPLAELKTLAEVGIMKLDDPQTLQVFFGDVQDISAQMEKVVTSLLELARADADLLQIYTEEVLLATLLNSTWSCTANSLYKDKHFKNEIPPHLQVHTDREKLELMVRNLLENAAHYSPKNAQLRTWVICSSQGIDLSIENPVIDLEASDIQHMNERFWRKEQARSDGGHVGLGLALVQALADTLGLEVELSLDAEKIFSAKIRGI